MRFTCDATAAREAISGKRRGRRRLEPLRDCGEERKVRDNVRAEAENVYRVTLVVECLGWVDLDVGCSTQC